MKISHPGDPLGAAYEAHVWSVLPTALRLSAPQLEDDVLEVHAGMRLTMFTSVRNNVYRFQSTVRMVDEEEGSFLLEMPHEAERTERRQFFRLVTRIVPRRCVLLDDHGNEGESVRVVILDLSGGGALLQSRDVVEPGSRLRMVFALEGDPLELDIAALVLSVSRPSSGAQQFRVHCQFLDPDKSETDRLVRFIYRQQLLERRKRAV